LCHYRTRSLSCLIFSDTDWILLDKQAVAACGKSTRRYLGRPGPQTAVRWSAKPEPEPEPERAAGDPTPRAQAAYPARTPRGTRRFADSNGINDGFGLH